MKTILFLASLMASSTYASVISGNAHDDIKSPSSSVVTIRGPNEPSGTLQVTDQHISSAGPDYSLEYFEPPSHSMSKRRLEVYCDIANFKRSQRESVNFLRQYMNFMGGTSYEVDGGPHPGRSRKIACKQNTAVWLYSDTMEINTQLGISIQDRIQEILNTCKNEGDENMIQGQSFGDSGYNVIVGADPCEPEIPVEPLTCNDDGCVNA